MFAVPEAITSRARARKRITTHLHAHIVGLRQVPDPQNAQPIQVLDTQHGSYRLTPAALEDLATMDDTTRLRLCRQGARLGFDRRLRVVAITEADPNDPAEPDQR